MSNEFIFGQPNAVCAICGFRYPLSRLRKNWKGQMVCREDFEPRHPQEFVRVRADRMTRPNMRPEPDPVFLDPNDVTADDL